MNEEPDGHEDEEEEEEEEEEKDAVEEDAREYDAREDNRCSTEEPEDCRIGICKRPGEYDVTPDISRR